MFEYRRVNKRYLAFFHLFERLVCTLSRRFFTPALWRHHLVGKIFILRKCFCGKNAARKRPVVRRTSVVALAVLALRQAEGWL